MKMTSAVPVPYFYYPGTSSTTRSRVRRSAVVRRATITPLEQVDELASKQEVACAALLGLSLASTVVLCFWQLVTA